MPVEGRQRAAVLNRCWSIYLSLTRAFVLPEEFHVQFPVSVETALVSGALQVTIFIGGDLTLSLREEYVFDRQELLSVSRYSYNVIESSGENLLRADNLPFHAADYRRRALTHPPHHIHDQQGRVYSFSGNVSDFIVHAKTLLSSRQ
jgi:hypothetical protein